MVKWIVVMKIQPSICIDDCEKKNLSQVGRHRDLNQGPPECESRALPLRHLTRWRSFCFVEYHHVKGFAASVLKRKISSLSWLTLSKFLIFTLI